MTRPSTIFHAEDAHIDLPDGLADAEVTLTLEALADGTFMLHVDVHAGKDVEVPFAIGVPLQRRELAALNRAVTQAALTMSSADGTSAPYWRN